MWPDQAALEAEIALFRARDDVGPFAVALDPVDALKLAALVQTALCRPDVPPQPRLLGERLLGAVRDYFTGYPAILALITYTGPDDAVH